MKTALENLGVSAKGASGAMRALGAAGAFAAALYATNRAMKALEGSMRHAVPSTEALTDSLLHLRDARVAEQLTKDLGDVGVALDRITDPGLRAKGFDWAHKAGAQVGFLASVAEKAAGGMGSFGEEIATSSEEAKAAIGGLDEAMARIATTGGASQAKTVLQQLADTYGLTADEVDVLVGQMPLYSDALKSASNDAELAAGSTDGYADAVEGLGQDAQDAAGDLKDLIDGMREQRAEAIRSQNAQINYQASLDDARQSIKDNGKTLDITTEKGRANKTALLDVASAWNDLNDKAKNAPGAHKAAIDSFVRLAAQMGMDEDKARAWRSASSRCRQRTWRSRPTPPRPPPPSRGSTP